MGEIGQVYVGEFVGVMPIENADKIEQAIVDCGPGGEWGVVVQKDTFKVGDLAEVYLQDTLVPEDDPRFDFMGSKKTKPIRMMRLRGCPSEALVLPLRDTLSKAWAGKDITEIVGATKYVKPIPMHSKSQIRAQMPSYIPKTDEPNFQKVIGWLDILAGQRFIATEKADGTSTTAFIDREGKFVVCSRRYIIAPPGPHWAVAEKYNVEDVLRSLDMPFALQWETVGPGVQKNPMGLKELEMRLFDIYDFEQHEYLQPTVMLAVAQENGLTTARVIESQAVFNMDANGLRIYAEGKYENGHPREGVVIRPFVNMRVGRDRLSFKVINLLYK